MRHDWHDEWNAATLKFGELRDAPILSQHYSVIHYLEDRSREIGYDHPKCLTCWIQAVINLVREAKYCQPIRLSAVNRLRHKIQGLDAGLGDEQVAAHRICGLAIAGLEWIEDHARGGLYIEPQYRRGRKDTPPAVYC